MDKELFKGRIFDVISKPAYNSQGDRQVVLHSGAAGAVIKKGGNVLLIKQYREAVDGCVIEIPAGLLEDGEEPERCVRREMFEEVGATGGRLRKLTEFYTSPGYSSEIFHLYLLEDPDIGQSQPEHSEQIELYELPIDEAVKKIYTGEITDSKTIIGLLMIEGEQGR